MADRSKSLTSGQKRSILRAVTGDVQLPRVTQGYVFGLAVTAFAVLLLPLLYFCMMILLAGLLLLLLRNADWIVSQLPPVVGGLLVGTVVLLGTGLLLAFLKPFLARSAAVKRPRKLKKDAEPFLSDYINQLCDTLGAPRPTAIHVTCELNAAAEFRRSWGGLTHRGLSLYLGLPLVAGMSLQQFTGILTHELGHFTQRTAMWLENMIRRTNQWFLRAASEPDAVDEYLILLSSRPGLTALCCLAILLMIQVSRRILLGFAFAGMAISCLMSRQMEYNADRCQVRIVGYRSLRSTIRRLQELDLAYQLAFRDIAAFHEEGRLPDDLIALSVANVSLITRQMKIRLRKLNTTERTGLFDTHPTMQDRIRAAERDGSPGIFPGSPAVKDLPASILFARFQELSRAVTEQYYRDLWDQKIPARMIQPVEKLLERQNQETNAVRALRRYFQTEIPTLRPLPLAPQSTEAPDDPDDVARHLESSRQRMLEELPDYQRISQRYQTAEATLFQTLAAQTLTQAQLRFQAAEYQLSEPTSAAIDRKLARAREGVLTLAGKMLPFETEAGNRLSFALQLLQVPRIVEQIHGGEDIWYEVDDLLPEAQYVSRLIGELPSLRIVYHRLMILWEKNGGRQPSDRVLKMILAQMSNLQARLVAIQQEMGNHLYPFDHAKAETTLREFALPVIPDERDLGGLVQATELMQSRLTVIQSRIFARLARAAEKIEDAIGMPPLPEPQADEAE